MALLTATGVQVFGHTAQSGPRGNASGNNVFGCYVSGFFAGTYAAENAQFTGIGGASGSIATSRRDGKTPTLLDAAFAAPGDEAGTKLGAKAVTVSTADITCDLTGGDLTTEHSGALLATVGEPVVLFVSYVLS